MQRASTDRRDFMKAAGVLAMTAAASSLGMRSASAQQVPYSAGTEAPKLKAPANACDCHMHIYDAKYPVAPSATLKPPDALVADYKLLQNRIGTTRNVIVTPSTYGTDNRDGEGKAERCGPLRPAGRMVARPGDAHRHPGAEPRNPLRFSAIRVTGRSEQSPQVCVDQSMAFFDPEA